MEEVNERILNYAREGCELREKFFSTNQEILKDCALRTARALARGNKLLLCGNGGSAADAQHIAGEFVNRFLLDRPALPAIALTTDTSTLTAIANDSHFNQVFARQIEALGSEGDVLLAISTSGNSANVLNAILTARSRKMLVIGLTGCGGGKMKDLCDLLVTTPTKSTPLIQELHLGFEHLFCSLTDYFLFENTAALNLDSE